jgi:3-oxoadipate enol-lactonase
MSWARNGPNRLYFEMYGRGETLVLIPGLGQSTLGWAQMIPRLEDAYQLVVVDPRGTGQSDKPEVPYTGEMFAGDLAAVLNEAGVERAHIMGLSMGGMIAQEFAIRFPDKVGSLILLSTYMKTDEWSRRLFEVRRNMIEKLGLHEHFKLSLMFVFSPLAFRTIREDIRAIESGLAQNPPNQQAYLRQIQFNLEHDTTDRLSKIAAPTLVITGSHDILTSTLQGRDLAAMIPGAEYREFPSASHGLWLEQGEGLASVVREFLGSHPIQ